MVMHDDAHNGRQQAAAPGRDAIEGQPHGARDVQPLRPAAGPKAGLSPPALPEGPSRCLTGAAFTRSHTASANSEKRSAQLRLIRARVAATSLTPNRSAMASALGQQLVVEQIDRQEARAILHRGRDLLGKRRPGFPPHLPQRQRYARCSVTINGSGRSNTASPRGHHRRQRQTTEGAG